MTPTPQAERRGFSLVEILVAVTLLACAMMSLAGAAALGLSQMGMARQDLGYSADVQQVADSLVGRGWGNVSTGSSTIRGRPVSWTVSTMSPNSQKIDLVVTRRGHAQTNVVYSDTVTLFVAKSRVQ
ncbi:MAG TPA: prepilin-type N-terminal cleavage/methylation domain-containing protein [Gemmatimonadaceae bacterium]|nr:prepilin-type N-terminal cleavage/methylation domain-containing protein [Gemmatimonadaceae bacterium]